MFLKKEERRLLGSAGEIFAGFVTPNPSFVTFTFGDGEKPDIFVVQNEKDMYKAICLLLLIALVTGFSLVLAAKSETIELSTPVLPGSPIIVLNR